MNKLPIVLISLVLWSCSPREMTMNQYVKWYQNNAESLSQEKVIGDYVLSLKYIPVEILAIKEFKENEGEDASLLETIASYGENEYFKLSIRHTKYPEIDFVLGESLDMKDYRSKKYEFLFGMDDNIFLETESTEIAPIFTHFEETQDIGGEKSILFAFPKNAISAKSISSLVFVDDILNTGISKFPLNLGLITKTPSLTL